MEATEKFCCKCEKFKMLTHINEYEQVTKKLKCLKKTSPFTLRHLTLATILNLKIDRKYVLNERLDLVKWFSTCFNVDQYYFRINDSWGNIFKFADIALAMLVDSQAKYLNRIIKLQRDKANILWVPVCLCMSHEPVNIEDPLSVSPFTDRTLQSFFPSGVHISDCKL